MTSIRILKPYEPKKILNSPISVDWQYLGDPVSALDKSVVRIFSRKTLKADEEVFDDGKVMFDCEVARTCTARHHIEDRIVDAYSDYLHRKQRCTSAGIKKLCFPVHFAVYNILFDLFVSFYIGFFNCV